MPTWKGKHSNSFALAHTCTVSSAQLLEHLWGRWNAFRTWVSKVHTAKFHSQEVFQEAPPGLSDIYILNLFEECPFRFLTLKKSCLSLLPVPITIILLFFLNQSFGNDIAKGTKEKKRTRESWVLWLLKSSQQQHKVLGALSLSMFPPRSCVN